MTDQKVAIVTGSSSGIGYETALVLARYGFRTYATMRNLEKAKAISDISKSEKFAVEGLSESIAYELEPFGIKIVIIEPGAIKTNFDTGMVVAQKNQNPSSPYYKSMQKLQSSINSVFKNGTPPTKVAEVILNTITTPTPNLRYTVGEDAALLAQKRKELPDSEFQKIVLELFK